MIHPIGELAECADLLRAERQYNAAARQDLAFLLDENLRLAQELTEARAECARLHDLATTLQRDLNDARRSELMRLLAMSPYRGLVA